MIGPRVVIKYKDRKYVVVLSSVYSTKDVNVSRIDHVAKQPIKRLECIHKYNSFMGGVGRSDEMVKYGAGMTTDKVMGKNICPCAQSHRFECVHLVQLSPSSPKAFTCSPEAACW